MSEQQFYASLESDGQRPRFELDASTNLSAQEIERRPCRPPAEDGANAHPFTDSDETRSSANDAPAADWREQVSAKVTSYKSRRPRKERYPSLHLQFEPSKFSQQKKPLDDFALDFHAAEASIPSETPILYEATARVLEFPRPTPAPIRSDELAEPVIDRPRIVEAPELLPPPPAMGGILIEAREDQQPERRPGFDVPLQSAELSRRVCAGTVDALLVATAAVTFGYVVLRLAGTLPPWRTGFEMFASLMAVLWATYQYSFLVFAGTTPGLRFAKAQIQRFDGSAVPRRLRRWRAFASILSVASLGIGYAWCLLDEDQLSWHDRITKTHLACDPKLTGSQK